MDFYDSSRLTINRGSEFNPLWFLSIDSTGGFVRLGEDKRVFSVVMFHQVHCIEIMQRSLRANTGDGDGHMQEHFQHCLSYLRQLFLCEADATLEPGDVLKEVEELELSERLPFTRECRDWSAVYDYMDTNLLDFREFRTANRTGHVFIPS